MRGRGGKKSFQQKMMYGFGALFAVSLLAFLLPHMLFHMLLSLAYPLPSSIQINLLMP